MSVRLGVRGKLFLVSVGLIFTVGLASVAFLEISLRGWLEERIEADVERQAQLAHEALMLAPAPLDSEAADLLADRLAEASQARFTIIRDDGTVLGDSNLDAEALAGVENHKNRPEVESALANGEGRSRRFSNTVGSELLYYSVPFERDDVRGVLRISLPLADVDLAVARLRLMLLIACAIGLVLAVIMSGLASHLMSRTLGKLVTSARRLARGEPSTLKVSSQDELGRLAGSLNKIADEMEDVVAELASEKNRFEAVFEGIAEAVIAVNESQKITVVNVAARDLLGLDDESTGSGIFDLIGIRALSELLTKACSGESTQLEFDLADKRILANANPQRGGGAVLVMHDVTRLRLLERIRRDFVANVSHELRTPVGVIRANAETLLDGALEDSPKHARRFVSAILRNSERLSALIVDLLDIARIESGQYPMDLTPVPVEGVVSFALESVEARAREKGMVMSCEVEPDLVAYADVSGLEHVVINLLENAVKYTPDSGRVVVRAFRDQDRIRVEIEDNGRGVKPKHRDRIFERFYRADKGRARSMGGTGLGLSIVKNLVTRMGGQVGFEPGEPRGSIFWVELPGSTINADSALMSQDSLVAELASDAS